MDNQNREAHQCGERNSNGITQPSGAATPRNSDTHKRIAVPRLPAFFGSTPDQAPKAAKLAVLIPGPGMLVNVRNAPRVVIPPPPRTFRKYCAQSEKTATSPSCKQITQPSGAATPRNSDAHKRIAVPQAFCVLREHPRPRPKSGKVRRSDTRPRRVSEPRKTLRG